jgi:hypothetical protein
MVSDFEVFVDIWVQWKGKTAKRRKTYSLLFFSLKNLDGFVAALF